MNGNTTIGVISLYYNSTLLCTIEGLEEELKHNSFYTAKQYCDWRYSTNLQRFAYDPFTGEKIDWKQVKQMITPKV